VRGLPLAALAPALPLHEQLAGLDGDLAEHLREAVGEALDDLLVAADGVPDVNHDAGERLV
jgi:hypothetical protein